jgi:hypothetical protein
MQALTSSMDTGRLYVDLKLLVNCFVSSSQLPIVSFYNLLNHDLAALGGVIANFALMFPWFLPIFLLLVDNPRAMIVAPEIHRIFADHGVA